MKKQSFLPGITLVLMLMITLVACKNNDAPAGTVFRFNPEKNKNFVYEIAWDMDQKVMDRDSRINLLAGYSFEVIADDGKVKTLKAVYRNFRLYMKIMDMEMDIDTNNPVAAGDSNDAGAAMKNIFMGIKGKSFTMRVDEEGNVIGVDGFDAIIQAMTDSVGMDEDMKLQMRASLQDQFNENELKNQFSQVFTIFPNKEVKTGDSWKKEYQVEGKMAARFSTTYTVTKIEEGQISLDSKTVITPAEGQMRVSGTQTGNLLVDSKTGLIVNAQFMQDVDAKMNDFGIKITGRGKITGSVQ